MTMSTGLLTAITVALALSALCLGITAKIKDSLSLAFVALALMLATIIVGSVIGDRRDAKVDAQRHAETATLAAADKACGAYKLHVQAQTGKQILFTCGFDRTIKSIKTVR